MECKLCYKKTEHLEKHHIIPKSKGGSNDKNNLISICQDCHCKVHNVSFRGKEGIISIGAQKAKSKHNEAIEWIKKNENLLIKKIDDIKYLDDYKHLIIIHLLPFIGAVKLKEFVLGKKNITIKLNLSNLLNQNYE